MVGASKVETEALEVKSEEESTKGTASTSCYYRLFTDEELDMLERGGDQVVKDEAEEYEKELEERLFPLDDKEVMLRVQRNAEKQEKPTLAEMSAVLGISEEVSERTRDVSSGALGTPEYWLNWYADTLETSTEAKRANRNFREIEGSDGRLKTRWNASSCGTCALNSTGLPSRARRTLRKWLERCRSDGVP
ncbi:hypothetical protein PC120_g27522 [Phytophthora cactorum]|nr:hypothetical protein PC120_g27522 [Phytophthora cactorum]